MRRKNFILKEVSIISSRNGVLQLTGAVPSLGGTGGLKL